MAAAVACGYVDKDGAAAARATIASGLDKGEREPRVLPEPISDGQQQTATLAAPGPAPKSTYIPLPVWTEPGPDGRPKLIGIGKDEPPVFDNEVRRHCFRRGGQVVRVKIKQKTKPAWIDWYLVRRTTDAVTGWQAKQPVGYLPVPYSPPSSPDAFAAARRGEMLAWPEGERDADTQRQQGFLAFTFGSSSDVPDLGELLRGHHVYITADNDKAGEICISRKIKAAIQSGVASIKIVRFPELPVGGDASDFFEAGAVLPRICSTELTRSILRLGPASPRSLARLTSQRQPPCLILEPRLSSGAIPRRSHAGAGCMGITSSEGSSRRPLLRGA